MPPSPSSTQPSASQPSSSISGASPHAKRKQPTIASFFTKKPSSSEQQAPSLVSSAGKSSLANGSESRRDAVVVEKESLDWNKGLKSQHTRRHRVEGENDHDEDEEDLVLPPPKRARTDANTNKDGPWSLPKQQQQLHAETQAQQTSASQLNTSSSQRTDRFRFSGVAASQENGETTTTAALIAESAPEFDDSEKTRRNKERERLHQQFVKKLGGPDCKLGIGRRRADPEILSAAVAGDAEEDGVADAEEGEELAHQQQGPPPPSKGRGGTRKNGGGPTSKLTPLERQVIEIKRKHMDTVLVVEVGYKFRFFGEDARIAAKELSIVCIPGKMRFDEHPSEAHLDRFASASIPVHRLHVHVKRLVTAGHKVGVVRQLETAALKAAGDNRNAPFVRKLTNLYTKGTYVDDAEGLEGTTIPAATGGAAPATGYMLCLTETNGKGWGNDEKVHVGIVAVQPATGDIIYDDFEDGFMRSEIETRLLHIAPCEFLIVGELSKATEKLIQHLSGSKTTVFGDKVRVERASKAKTAAAEAHSHVSSFYAGKMEPTSRDQDVQANNLLQKVLGLSEQVTICLSAMIKHMMDYGLEHVFDLTKYFQSFSARSHMLLNGNTLVSLEIYQNQTDHTSRGSLFWMLDRTQTRFGHRLLRKWVGRPLLDKMKLEERVNAVEEMKDPAQATRVERLRGLLGRIKTDLEKNLIRIYYGKCTRPELVNLLQTMQMIATEFSDVKSSAETGFQSMVVGEAIANLPTMLKDVLFFLNKINMVAAKNDDKYEFFRETEETEEITEHKLGIAGVEHELDEHRADAAATLGRKKVEYSSCAGIDYLIEVENSSPAIKRVPASWVKVSGTKRVSRFHTPEVIQMTRQRDQHKESLAAACDKAYATLLADISAHYQSFRDCIQSLATLDCLLSLVAVANQPGYVKPEYTGETCIRVEQGRHPMVEQLLLDTYVPNDIHLETEQTRALLVTGPNMGGKSSFVRQVALIAIMGQIGSYVPAQSATLGMLDAVFTRMGAFDNMLAGESTFMVELSETADILKQATPRSLVILDELGRGTSTHDGVAIAHAVLDYMVRTIRSLTLFITHYQHLSSMVRSFPAHELRNVHMRFTESGGGGGGSADQEITFLYEVGEGVAHRSYGLNVARLANLPPAVIDVARLKSAELEGNIRRRRLVGLVSAVAKITHDSTWRSDETIIERLIASAEQL